MFVCENKNVSKRYLFGKRTRKDNEKTKARKAGEINELRTQ